MAFVSRARSDNSGRQASNEGSNHSPCKRRAVRPPRACPRARVRRDRSLAAPRPPQMNQTHPHSAKRKNPCEANITQKQGVHSTGTVIYRVWRPCSWKC